jgi:hypothetical protein
VLQNAKNLAAGKREFFELSPITKRTPPISLSLTSIPHNHIIMSDKPKLYDFLASDVESLRSNLPESPITDFGTLETTIQEIIGMSMCHITLSNYTFHTTIFHITNSYPFDNRYERIKFWRS